MGVASEPAQGAGDGGCFFDGPAPRAGLSDDGEWLDGTRCFVRGWCRDRIIFPGEGK